MDQNSINRSIDQIVQDIKNTSDPFKKVILQEILKLKLRQRDAHEPNDINSVESTDFKDDRKNKPKTYDDILKDQEDSLDSLNKINKLKAYQDLINENEKDNIEKVLDKKRGKNEKYWRTKDNASSSIDPKYAKYVEQDHANNKLMERLNCEVDFRLDGEGHRKCQIIKPFENNMSDNDNLTDTFATFEPIGNKSNLPTTKGLGKRRSISQRR